MGAHADRIPFLGAVIAFAVVMAGTTVPTPLYALYADRLQFGVLTTTAIFAVYAVGVLTALIACGTWSDAIGRRPMLFAGVVLSVLSAIVFLTAGPVWQLVVGRILSGLAAGVYTGTATAAVIGLAPEKWRKRAPAIATAANIGGLGLGTLGAGLLAEFAPAPLQLPFAVNLVLLAVAGLGIWAIPEPKQGSLGQLTLQIVSVPPEARAVFARSGLAAAAGFAVMGSFTSVAPSFLSQIMHEHNHATAGAVVGLLFLCSAASQLPGRSLPTAKALVAGCAILVLGMGALVAALALTSLPVMVVATAIIGVGQGLSFSKGLAAVLEASPLQRQSEVASAYFVVAYLAISIPVVAEGLAASIWGLFPAGITLCATVAVLAMIALAGTVKATHGAHARTS